MLPDVTEHTRATSFADSIVRPLVKSLPLVCAGLAPLSFVMVQVRTNLKAMSVSVWCEVMKTLPDDIKNCTSVNIVLKNVSTNISYHTIIPVHCNK